MAFIRRFVGNETVRHAVFVLVATMAGNIAAFGYHAVVSRRLGVSDYGALYSLISFASLVILPVGFLPTVVAKYAAEFHSLSDEPHMASLVRFVVGLFALIGVAYGILLCLFAAPIGSFFRVSPLLVPPAAMIAAVGALSPALRALLQGEGKFEQFSLASASEGIGKLVFGFAGISAGLGVTGGLAGFACGGLCGIAAALFSLRKHLTAALRVPIRIDWRRVIQTSVGAAAISFTAAILTSSDVILVKHFFSQHDTGLYSAASLGGKILLFAVGFAPTVLLTNATQKHTRGEKATGALVLTAAMLSIVAIVGLFCFAVAGNFVLSTLVGAQFSGAVPLLVSYGAAMTLLAGTTLVCSYALALHRLTFAAPVLLVSLTEPVGILCFHGSLMEVIQVIVASNMLALVTALLALYFDSYRARAKRTSKTAA